jgi:hypothetical protein
MPTLLKGNSALLCISTPLGTENWYTLLMALRDAAGNELFKSFAIDLLCQNPRCRDDPSLCDITHCADKVPSWHTLERHKLIRQAMAGDDRLVQRELLYVYFNVYDMMMQRIRFVMNGILFLFLEIIQRSSSRRNKASVPSK